MAENKQFSNSKTFLFVLVLCFSCALVLSILAHFLRGPQMDARELYKSKQLLQASRILSYEGTFILPEGTAVYDPEKQVLVPSPGKEIKAKPRDILTLVSKRILARVVDAEGNLYTFKEAGLDEAAYMRENAKYGYSNLPYKLVYLVQPNLSPKDLPSDLLPYGYVIPVNGYGLWDAIYGYLGLEANADTVLGMTWYDQKETPGLGGNIALPSWQEQFYGKLIFQKDPSGQTNFERALLGIKVVKTTVQEVYGKSPLAKSAVDGIAGASITVVGVNEALRMSLAPYRPFLIKAHERFNEVH